MSTLMARCWVMRMSLPRSRSAGAITRRSGWAPITWINSSAGAVGQDLPLSCFQAPRQTRRIEQDRGCAILCQAVAQRFQLLSVQSKRKGEGLIILQAFGREFTKAE